MADSAVAITAGTGTNVDTRTVTGGDHRQVMVPAGETDAEVGKFVNTNPGATDYGLVVRPFGPKGALAAPAAISVATTPTLLMAANTGRDSLLMKNNSSQIVYIGASGVTTAAGFPVAVGETLVDDTSTTAWYGIVTAGTAEVRVAEIA